MNINDLLVENMATVIPSITGGQVEAFLPGDRITCTVGATAVLGGQLVEFSGDRTVIPAGANSLKVFGVAMHDAAIGAKVVVATEGVWLLKASGAIAAGDTIKAGAAGVAVAVAADGDPRLVVGIALAAIVDTALGPVKLRR